MFATMLLVESRPKDDGVRYLRMRSPRVLSVLFVDTKPIVTASFGGETYNLFSLCLNTSKMRKAC